MGTKLHITTRVIVEPEEAIDFDDIRAFRTKNFTGFLTSNQGWVVIKNESDDFKMIVEEPDDVFCNIEELNDWVYFVCNEHITEVFEHQMYKIEMIDKE